MNKREFMLAAGAAGLAGTAWSAAAPAWRAPAWRERVGQSFLAPAGRGMLRLVLARCDEHAARAPLHQFTLVFRTGSRGAPAAGVYALRGEDGVEQPLYLAQAGRDADGTALLRADCCHLVG